MLQSRVAPADGRRQPSIEEPRMTVTLPPGPGVRAAFADPRADGPAPARPVWLETLATGLVTHAHLVVSGNTDDLFPVRARSGTDFVALDQAIRMELARRGVATVLTFDPVDGPAIYTSPEQTVARPIAPKAGLLDSVDGSPATLADLVRMVSAARQDPAALIVRYASHLAPAGSDALRRLLISVDKIARAPAPRAETPDGAPARNPVLWLLDQPGDLPDWFVVGNPAVRQIRVDLPDLEERHAYARSLLPRFHEAAALAPEARDAALQQFALLTGGMTLRGMRAVADLARREGLGLDRAGDAIRGYRTGARRNPWRSPLLLDRLTRGEALLKRRVKGQDRAIAQTLQLLSRSVLGLSGARAGARLDRPRGVLFFAGPTGVGKTELAKAVTELLFGDEASCQRFDMTEFASETSIARLIGAPPGYPGHEFGGELTNALRRRPFSVILFDEVEKAHPRVLDMFLQILDDGRLTDSRGETAYFSDAIVIFTSNMGMLGDDRATNLGMEILPSDSHDTLHRKLVEGIGRHFVKDLRRPELLNRIGQSVVAFSFIHHASAVAIFEAAVARVLESVRSGLGIELTLAAEARETLAEMCLYNVMEGGRGIANRVETRFVNPLSAALLDHLGAARLEIRRIERIRGEIRVELAPPEAAVPGGRAPAGAA
jgi:hypothetical protein